MNLLESVNSIEALIQIKAIMTHFKMDKLLKEFGNIQMSLNLYKEKLEVSYQKQEGRYVRNWENIYSTKTPILEIIKEIESRLNP